MKPVFLLLLPIFFWWFAACNNTPATAPTAPARDANADDAPNKIQYGCACGSTNGGKQWLEKPIEATVNTNDVLVRWHPFSPKAIRVAQKAEKVVLYAFLDYKLDAFTLMKRDTYALVNQDTVFLNKGKRGFALWEDTVTQVVKVRFRDLQSSQDYFSAANDSNSFKVLLHKSMVEILPNTRWYYLKTSDDTDACIMDRYLHLPEKL